MKLLRTRWFQLATLIAFFAVIGIQALRLKYCVLDFDIWWHLKVGDWILEHFALPHTGILSRTAANLPWVAYSWGYEIMLSRAYAWFGLIGIGVFGIALTIGVAFTTFWMIGRLSRRFWPSVILAAITCYAFLFSGMPRPVFFSEMLFCVTLTLLLEAQRTGRVQSLYWLPLVFFAWANLHIQFIYGLFALGLFVAVNVLLGFLRSAGYNPSNFVEPALPLKPLFLILGASALATILGPNFYHPYLAVLTYTKAKFAYTMIVELQPLTFRGLADFVELFLAAAGFYAVGWQKKLDVFKLVLLVAASVVAFRTMRDAWFVCFSAAACLADLPVRETSQKHAYAWPEIVTVGAAVLVLLFLGAQAVDFDGRGLDRAISSRYPVNAVNFLRQNPVPGPLYNNLNWGGFLMWYLPELPVAIDGRNDLYGDDLDRLFYHSESAFPSYTTDPYLNESGVVILDSHLPLAKILTIDPRFQMVKQDDIATVFVRRR